MTTIVNCPTCDKEVPWNSASKFRPFCSERCKLIDLGEWADEKHKISEKIPENPASSLDIEEIEAMLAAKPDDFFKP